MQTCYLRNIGIIAHIDVGKTTFTERVLFYSGSISHMGEVHDGSATTDFMHEERERGITIASASVSCSWHEHLITLIDTPGHVDFTIEVERSLRVLDAAIGIFDGVSGVEPQSERVWRQATKHAMPKMAVINKMDREGASFEKALLSLQEKLGISFAPITVPYGEGENFCGVLDIVRECILLFPQESKGKEVQRLPFDDEAQKIAEPWREHLLNVLTEEDDTLLAMWISGQPICPSTLDESIRRATQERNIVPVFATSAVNNIGIQPVLDGVVSYLPSPKPFSFADLVALSKERTQRSLREEGTQGMFCEENKQGSLCEEGMLDCFSDATLPCSNQEEEFCGFVFNVAMVRKQKILFVRIYSGSVTKGKKLVNTSKNCTGVVEELLRVFAEDKEPIDVAEQGEIVAIRGVDASTGDTLTSGSFLQLEPVAKSAPVIAMTFETQTDEARVILLEALTQRVWEDPTLSWEDKEGRILVSGMGELQLEVLRDRIEREYSLDVRLGNPHVVCREVLISQGEKEVDLSLDILGVLQRGKLKVKLSPHAKVDMTSIEFEDKQIKTTWKHSIERGIKEACSVGRFGYPLVGYHVFVSDVASSSTEDGIYLAAQHACASALTEAETRIEEPIMRIVITVPNNYVGNALTLVKVCGAHVSDCSGAVTQTTIQALAPLNNVFGFATRLRSSTQGRGDVFMEFSHFSQENEL